MEVERLLQMRKERGYEIAKKQKVVQKDGIWLVPSATNPNKTYQVELTIAGAKCNCEDYLERGIRCKHAFAVDYVITKTMNKDGTTTITETKRITYPQNWKAYNMASVQQKELYLKLLNDLCQTIDEPVRIGAGRPSMPLKDMVFASALKVYTTFSLRRFGTDIKEAQAKGYVAKAPDYSTTAKYMEDPKLTPIIKELIQLSAMPLKSVEDNSFSIDSSGITPSKFSRWFDHKYGKERDRKIWYKVHLLIGNKTQIACGVEITSQYVSDMKMLPQLVQEASRNFEMKELTADKGYMSRSNVELIDKLGVVPYIPFKENMVAKPRGKSHVWRNLYNYFTLNHDAFLEHYHQRSNIETAFFMIKSKFGDFVRSKTETACVNEILLKVLSHNLCVVISEMFELGIEPNFLG